MEIINKKNTIVSEEQQECRHLEIVTATKWRGGLWWKCNGCALLWHLSRDACFISHAIISLVMLLYAKSPFQKSLFLTELFEPPTDLHDDVSSYRRHLFSPLGESHEVTPILMLDRNARICSSLTISYQDEPSRSYNIFCLKSNQFVCPSAWDSRTWTCPRPLPDTRARIHMTNKYITYCLIVADTTPVVFSDMISASPCLLASLLPKEK
jgi:hypothetical protein